MMVIFSSSLFLNCPYFILTSSRELYISSLGDVSKCRCYISSLRFLIAIKLLIFVKLSIHIFMFLFISQYRIRSCSVQIFIFYPCLFSFTCIMFHFFSVILFCDSFISSFFSWDILAAISISFLICAPLAVLPSPFKDILHVQVLVNSTNWKSEGVYHTCFSIQKEYGYCISILDLLSLRVIL